MNSRKTAEAMMFDHVAVIIPCLNEEHTIGDVVREFSEVLPEAVVYVCDNGSSDGSAARAKAAGAVVRCVSERGKGHAVRRMFADVEADIYLLVDADGTYPAKSAPRLIAAIENGCDMAVGVRAATVDESYPRGHRWGNAVLTAIVSGLFARRVGDLLSGYRAFSRRFVKSFPAAAHGFEIETELTLFALEQRLATAEIGVAYLPRADGTESKLHTVRDGMRILAVLLLLLKEARPLLVFGGAALALWLSVLLLAGRGASPIVSAVLFLGGVLSLGVGIILDSLARLRRLLIHQAFLREGAEEGVFSRPARREKHAR